MQVTRGRRDLLETLLQGTAESSLDMRELASSFALVPGADFLVVVMTGTSEVQSPDAEVRASETLTRYLALGIAQPFVVLRQREIISIAPVARARPGAIAHLVRLAHAELGQSWSAGISTLCAGLGEIARGYQEARQARIAGGVRALLEQSVHEYVLEHADGTAARMIPPAARRVLQAEDRFLIDTLDAYIRAEMSIRETADLLSVHPNTVTYRLDKLGKALGRDLTRFSDLVEVLTWRRLLERL